MRLDLFLKVSRLINRRPLAQKFCDAGFIIVNGSVAKSSKEVKVGDLISINRRTNITTFEVIEIPKQKQMSKTATTDLYKLVSTKIVPEENLLA